MSGARRHVVTVSGSRADYGLLIWPMRRIAADPTLHLSVLATGMHLSQNFGMTVDQFAADGFEVAARVPTLDAEDSAAGIARAIGRGVAGCAEAFGRLKPDLVLLLGDRYEIFAAAQAAFVTKIPIAHLCGGDVTHGALDDAFRHAISKMASLHFPSNAESARRLRQLGEPADRIFAIGSPGLDQLRQETLPDRAALEAALGHTLAPRYLLVTFHPLTLDATPTRDQLEALLHALAALPREIGLVFTLSNADAEGPAVNRRIESFTRQRPTAHAHVSLGSARYLGLMRHAAAVVGNSSSGLYEAPSLGVPTVNIGRRQEGRLRASSVIDCPPQAGEISRAIDAAMAMDCAAVANPYGDGHASEKLVAALKRFDDWPSLVFKTFQDL
jgi:UDP-N-acetylglucosamine 2-epimerase (non-hydrolysing)/GDP/UDP-N,N'-diacetylbacillosamine 2-epimerase (hydrolysing)